MKFYPHWAKAEAKARTPDGKVFPLACWRWSEASLAEARALAQEAVSKLAERVSREGGFPGRYLYQDRPVREPLLREVKNERGEMIAAITRNAYGCLVLNTTRVMFIDVDLPPEQPAIKPGFLARLFGKQAQPAVSHESLALERAEFWVRDHPGWRMRAYRTRAGLRYLIAHDLFDPTLKASSAIMQGLDADPLYRKLCLVQESFRARLTPKPWRVGMAALSIRYPYDAMAGAVDAWVKEYEGKGRGSAVCALVREIGDGPTHPEAARVIALHDEMAQVGSGMPLA